MFCVFSGVCVCAQMHCIYSLSAQLMNFTLTELNWINTELTWALKSHYWLVRAALQHNLNLLLLWKNLYCRKRYRNKAVLTCVHDKPTTAALHNTSLHCFRPDRVFHRVLFGLQKSRTSTASEIWITSCCSTGKARQFIYKAPLKTTVSWPMCCTAFKQREEEKKKKRKYICNFYF